MEIQKKSPIDSNPKDSEAIAGALFRMSEHSNSCESCDILSLAEFGDWDDWDNGHSDGPTD